jgi:hypothetical protein
MNGYTVKTHHDLPKATEDDVRLNSSKILTDADQGIQTAIVAKDGRIRSVVGLNGVRYLPDPDPDPLDELLRLAIEGPEETTK